MVKLLDSFFGILNILVKNEVLAVSGIWVEVLALAHLDRDNWSTGGEALDQLFLSDLGWDVLHEQIGLKGLSDCLLDGVAIGSNLVVSLRNVLSHKEIGSIIELSLVLLVDGLTGRFGILEANETLVLELAIRVCFLNNGRGNLSILSENLTELCIIVGGWKSLNKNVQTFLFSVFALISSLMGQNLKTFSFQFDGATSLDGLLCLLLVLELNVTKASALSILEALDFAGSDSSKLSEGLGELSLRNADIQVLNKHVGFWINEVVLLDSTSDVASFNLGVVKLFSASSGF